MWVGSFTAVVDPRGTRLTRKHVVNSSSGSFEVVHFLLF